MRRRPALSAVLAALGVIIAAAGAGRAPAKDFGQQGAVFPVAEPDLLATIKQRLHQAEASGELARTNAAFVKSVQARVRRPAAIGLTATERDRSWHYDPTISLERDIRDQKGRLIGAAGQRINPLDFVSLSQDLVFIDGDDPDQLDWAISRFSPLKAKIIFVAGSPSDEMSARHRRFYFDQEGRLTTKFGIEHVPAVVAQEGRVLRVSEIQLGKRGQG